MECRFGIHERSFSGTPGEISNKIEEIRDGSRGTGVPIEVHVGFKAAEEKSIWDNLLLNFLEDQLAPRFREDQYVGLTCYVANCCDECLLYE